MKIKEISVIGMGYIGLPTAAMFASNEIKVLGVDINEDVVSKINQGKIHIVEPDLDKVVSYAVKQGFLRASTNVESADAFIVAVPTPFKENHEPDLTYIKSAANSVAKVLKKGDLIILESTAPVGATEQMTNWLAESRPDLSFPITHGENSDIRVAHCPERVLPGQILKELISNDRVVGGLTPKCSSQAANLYKHIITGECVITNARTAEMAKLSENAFRDVNIAFANELSMICDENDINVRELIKLTNLHPRVNILNPGVGVGGHCIAVDPWFIVHKNPKESNLIRMSRNINDNKLLWVVEKIKKECNKISTKKTNKPPKVACFGLSYKPNIDDLRESPAVKIVKLLSEYLNEKIIVVEPNIDQCPVDLTDSANLVSIQEAIRSADIITILTKHDEFLDIDLNKSSDKILLDFVGL